jgi:opacity protein-like surface antigen
MKRPPILLASLLLLAAVPAWAQYGRGPYASDNGLRLSLGLFEPDAESSYWASTFADFTGEPSDFEDWTLGVEYVRDLRGNLRLLVGGSLFEGQTDQAYRDFVDADDNPIVHDTTLTLATATVGLAVRLVPREAPVIPYLGVGGGLYAWSLEESGDFIDFVVDPLEIFPATFKDDGVTVGWYWMGGIEVPVSSSLSLFAQGRWHRADDELQGDFQDLGDLDLSGREISGGLSWRF